MESKSTKDRVPPRYVYLKKKHILVPPLGKVCIYSGATRFKSVLERAKINMKRKKEAKRFSNYTLKQKKIRKV